MTRCRDEVSMNAAIVPLANTVRVKGMTTGQVTVQLDFTALVELTT